VRLDRLPAKVRDLFRVLPTKNPPFISIVEMASASGLALLTPQKRDPWATSTLGTGEVLREAAADAAAVLLGIGGSATNDLGLGALTALGYAFLNANGEVIANPSPSHWPELSRIEGQLVPNFPPLYVACDVTNPLLGPNGCAAVYGTQKGLRPEDRPRLEALSATIADTLCDHTQQPRTLRDVPGAGAAGGISFGLMAGAGARLLSGSDLMMDWMDLPTRIRNADIVITGEGRFDESSLQGKGPGAIINQALTANRIVHVFAGQVTTDLPRASLHAISPAEWSRERALSATATSLPAAIRRVFA
jgi:glycerate kinase